MKLAARTLSALAAAGLVIGAMASAPALAGKKAEAAPKTIFDYIEADLKAIDKALFGPFTKTKK